MHAFTLFTCNHASSSALVTIQIRKSGLYWQISFQLCCLPVFTHSTVGSSTFAGNYVENKTVSLLELSKPDFAAKEVFSSKVQDEFFSLCTSDWSTDWDILVSERFIHGIMHLLGSTCALSCSLFSLAWTLQHYEHHMSCPYHEFLWAYSSAFHASLQVPFWWSPALKMFDNFSLPVKRKSMVQMLLWCH